MRYTLITAAIAGMVAFGVSLAAARHPATPIITATHSVILHNGAGVLNIALKP